MRRLLSCLAVLTMFSGPLNAQTSTQDVALESSVYVERHDRQIRVVEAAKELRPGDRVVTILRWDAPSNGPLVMTSAVPAALNLEAASSEQIIVSTDGGQTWRRFNGIRPERVTHLRWRASQGPGRLTYSAIVR